MNITLIYLLPNIEYNIYIFIINHEYDRQVNTRSNDDREHHEMHYRKRNRVKFKFWFYL